MTHRTWTGLDPQRGEAIARSRLLDEAYRVLGTATGLSEDALVDALAVETAAHGIGPILNVEAFGASPGASAAVNRAAIQATIDALPDTGPTNVTPTGGTIQFPGRYAVDGSLVIDRGGVVFQGTGLLRSELRFSHPTADLITNVDDPDRFSIRDMTLTQLNGSGTGHAVNFATGFTRQPSFERVDISGFLKGIQILGSAGGYDLNCRFNGPARGVVGGLGLKLVGTNGWVSKMLYLNNFETGAYTDGAAITFENTIPELNGTAFYNAAGNLRVISPWISSDAGTKNTLDFDLQSAALLLGYGSGNWNISYLNSTVQDRTVIIPDANDRLYGGATAGGPAGIKLGKVLIDSLGDLYGLGTIQGNAVLSSAGGPSIRIVRTTTGLRFDFQTDGIDGQFFAQDGGDFSFNTHLLLNTGKGLKVNAIKVVGDQGAAVADATDAASAITQLNALLARARAHGLIAT